jgi:hypothetical protein
MHMLKQEVADQLTRLITPMEGRRILEVGTGWAESTEFFSKLKPEWKIYTIDGFGLYGDGRIYATIEHEKVLKINQKIRKCGNVIQILGDSSTIPWELPINVLFLDGNHSSPFVSKGGIVCFDDYSQENNPNNGVKQVVDEILESYGIGKIGREKWELAYAGYYCAILLKTEAL